MHTSLHTKALLFIGLVATNQPNANSQVYWNFNSLAPSSTLPATISGGTFSSGQNTGTFGLSGTSASSGYTGSSGGNNLNIGVAPTGTFSSSGSAYFTFTLSATGDTALEATGLSLGSRSTGSGPTLLSLYTSTDNFASNSNFVGSVTATANSTWTRLTFAPFDVTSPLNGALTFRLYGSGGNGTTGGGNWRIDDVTLLATVIPEPATATLACGSLALIAVILRRRRG